MERDPTIQIEDDPDQLHNNLYTSEDIGDHLKQYTENISSGRIISKRDAGEGKVTKKNVKLNVSSLKHLDS